MTNQTLSEQRALRRIAKFNNHPRTLLGAKPTPPPAALYFVVGLVEFVVVFAVTRMFA